MPSIEINIIKHSLKAKKKLVYIKSIKGDFPLIVSCRNNFLTRIFDEIHPDRKESKHLSNLSKKCGFPMKGMVWVPASACELQATMPYGEIHKVRLRKPFVHERILLWVRANQEDEIFCFSKLLSRPCFKPLKRLIITLYSLILRILLGKQKNSLVVQVPTPHRIGHGLSNVDVALNEIFAGRTETKPKKIKIVYPNSTPLINTTSITYPKPFYLTEFQKGFIQRKDIPCELIFRNTLFISALLRLTRKSGGKIYPMRKYGHRDLFNVLKKVAPLYKTPPETKAYGESFLRNTKHDPSRETILIANREPGVIIANDVQEESARYGFRNSAIENCISTIEYLSTKYNVFRVGCSTRKLELKCKNFFDLSTMPSGLEKTQLDFYLFSLCKFFIGTSSGIYAIGQLMKKPIVWTNTVPIGSYSCWSDWDISLFKILRDAKTHKQIPFHKTLELHEGWGQHADMYSSRYEYIENTDDEILQASIEMERQLKKGSPNKQTFLNRRLIKHYPSMPDLYLKHRGTVSEYFLKKHKHLL